MKRIFMAMPLPRNLASDEESIGEDRRKSYFCQQQMPECPSGIATNPEENGVMSHFLLDQKTIAVC